jgi:primosomal protein N' (replication factor Y)
MSTYAEIVVTLPIEGRFHYAVPPHLENALAVGHRVLVPFGRRKVTGFVVALTNEIAPDLLDKVRPIEERLDAEPLVPEDVLALATFTADYYLAPVGEVLKLALPPGITGATKSRYHLTQAARHFMDTQLAVLPNGSRLSGPMRKILEAAIRPTGVAAKDANPKAAAELETLGFLTKRETSAAKDGGGEIDLYSRTGTNLPATRSAARRAVWDVLLPPKSAEDVEAELEEDFAAATIKNALKELLKEKLIEKKRVAVEAAPETTTAFGGVLETGPRLMPEQERALEQINRAVKAREAKPFLLHGVTGSGKTEVYLRAIAEARRDNKGAIVLVPEIALTPQLEARFRARFGDDVAVMHSALADSERRSRWQKLRRGEAKIALGPRSAVWAPVVNLGIVVVDEEHDASFKQGSDVRYQGRDLAMVRAHKTKSVIVLGSATPSMETLQLVRQNRVTELRLDQRALNRPMPTIEVVDLAEERRAVKGEPRILTRPLADRLRAVVEAKEQAILFLNRRGFNTVVYCDDCGAARTCDACDVSLTYHKTTGRLVCHYCDRQSSLEAPCTSCQGHAIRPFGIGTQRVVEAVREEVAHARVLRLDRDITSQAGGLDKTLAMFREGEADILVGTQMVAKGHDFPRVTLVGIVLADASLAFPDFRAAERTFQLLTQVSGRAGRAEAPGRVIIQTFQRNHYALTAAVAHDSDRFFEIESGSRSSAGYPPFQRLAAMRFESKNANMLKSAMLRVRRIFEKHTQADLRFRGPVPAPIARIRDRHRQLALLFAPTPARLTQTMRRVRAEIENAALKIDVVYDLDPVDLL